MAFSSDVNSVILTDIIRMLKIVKEIASNPLSCKDDQIVRKSVKNKNKQLQNDENNYKKEAQLIENTISKIGVLLALSFGELGCEIIASNVAKNGELNLMMPGKKTTAIFGYLHINNFSDVSDIL